MNNSKTPHDYANSLIVQLSAVAKAALESAHAAVQEACAAWRTFCQGCTTSSPPPPPLHSLHIVTGTNASARTANIKIAKRLLSPSLLPSSSLIVADPLLSLLAPLHCTTQRTKCLALNLSV